MNENLSNGKNLTVHQSRGLEEEAGRVAKERGKNGGRSVMLATRLVPMLVPMRVEDVITG